MEMMRRRDNDGGLRAEMFMITIPSLTDFTFPGFSWQVLFDIPTRDSQPPQGIMPVDAVKGLQSRSSNYEVCSFCLTCNKTIIHCCKTYT